MSVLIESISFDNYRQFGVKTLHFRTSGKNALSVFIAKNGTGKTTLLNAITWCLYEKEFQTKATDSDKLPAINTVLINKSNVGKTINVSVKLTVLDDHKTIEFCRTLPFTIEERNGKLNAKKGTASFTTSITSSEKPLENTGIKRDDDAVVLVKQYFDETIYNFYFFDGEKLGEFFDIGRTKNIKESIFNISQISLLDNACSHVERIRFELGRKASASGEGLEELYARREELKKLKQACEENRDSAKKKIERLDKQIEDYDAKLRAFKPIKALQEERDDKERRVKRLEAQLEELENKRSVFYRRYLTLIPLYPRIKATLSIIDHKEASGELPPIIDSDLILRILNEHIKECPLCAGKIGDASIQHLQDMLTRINVSSSTSNNLKEIKGPLQDYIEEIERYKDIRDQINNEEIDITDRIDALNTRLKEISKLLAGFNEGSDADAISNLEKQRNNAINRKSKENQNLGAANTQIKNYKSELDSVIEEIKQREEKKKEFAKVRKTLKTYDMLYDNFGKIKDIIMNGMKNEISETTWKTFCSMIWKHNTFGKIEIDDNYAVTVFDKAGRKMTGSLSATEQMALAYAFTLAIHKASGKNCPLVIDSPLGRVSDDNRTKMAKALLEISETKQIIMLFTPDEFSDSVKKLYSRKVQISNLVLSDDEQYVQEVQL